MCLISHIISLFSTLHVYTYMYVCWVHVIPFGVIPLPPSSPLPPPPPNTQKMGYLPVVLRSWRGTRVRLSRKWVSQHFLLSLCTIYTTLEHCALWRPLPNNLIGTLSEVNWNKPLFVLYCLCVYNGCGRLVCMDNLPASWIVWRKELNPQASHCTSSVSILSSWSRFCSLLACT